MSNPIKGRPEQVVPLLTITIENVVSADLVGEFCIGRTVDLDASSTKHGCNSILSLYETESPVDVVEVEDRLIEAFIHHPKCSNSDGDIKAATSEKFMNYVYVAIWYSEKKNEHAA